MYQSKIERSCVSQFDKRSRRFFAFLTVVGLSDSFSQKTKIIGLDQAVSHALEISKSDIYEPSYATSKHIRFTAFSGSAFGLTACLKAKCYAIGCNGLTHVGSVKTRPTGADI